MMPDPYFLAREQVRIEERTAFEKGRIRQILQEEFWRERSPYEDNALTVQDDALRLSEQGRPREARWEILRAYYLLPSNKEIGQNLLLLSNSYADKLIAGELYDDALGVLLTTRGLGLVNGSAHHHLSWVYYWMGRPDDSIEESKEALRYRPDAGGWHIYLAHSYMLKAMEAWYVQRDSAEAKHWQRLSAKEIGIGCDLDKRLDKKIARYDVYESVAWSLQLLQMPQYTPFNPLTWLLGRLSPLLKATNLAQEDLITLRPYLNDQDGRRLKTHFNNLVHALRNPPALPEPRRAILALGEGIRQ